jgi:hypothetical protein
VAQDLAKKEALFNEVKGSLFEYLVARELAVAVGEELAFQRGLDRNYLAVLSQQDRMVRQFYPEMLAFLARAARETAARLAAHFGAAPRAPRVVGKFSNSDQAGELHEADLLLELGSRVLPVSLKLNKKNAFVNTKSGGIKSFFTQYFPFLPAAVQESFNRTVDLEFGRMAVELHALHELDYPGNFGLWVARGFSELPGELDADARTLLKAYYARIAAELHRNLARALADHREDFLRALPTLLGFGAPEILQVVYFHDFPGSAAAEIDVHAFSEVEAQLPRTALAAFAGTASAELAIGTWVLHVRVKPMNKFTTTAIKVNCSVKVRRPSSSG